MSLIIIDHPYADMNMCATCFQHQLVSFRNKIKEQWNRYNNDGKKEVHRIPLELDSNLPMEPAAFIVNGSGCCPTHMFNDINKRIAEEVAMAEAAKKPKLDIPGPAIDSKLFRKN